MFAQQIQTGAKPPLTPAMMSAGKVSRLLLIALCAAPVALFPVALVHRAVSYFLP